MNISYPFRRMIERERASSEVYTKFLKKKGVRIGDGTYFYAPKSVEIDITRPYLIEIGKNVHITRGVVMLTHGYDWAVLRGIYHEMIGSAAKITIGNNVFIGADTTILKGVTIGDNVIIGAKSLVKKDVPANSVVAGNPAKYICDLESYRAKREVERVDEAKQVVKEYLKCYGKVPPVEELYEFFWIFEKRDSGKIPGYTFPTFNKRMRDKEVYTLMEQRYYETKSVFDSYEVFVQYCISEMEREKNGSGENNN